MIQRLFNSTKALEKSMDAAWLRNEAISQNIANVDTPGYKRKTVNFEEHLSQAFNEGNIEGLRTDKRHIQIGTRNAGDIDINVTQDNKDLSMRLDGNNVDIDSEMASMAKNTIRYNTLTRSLSDEFKRLRSVISEGRR